MSKSREFYSPRGRKKTDAALHRPMLADYAAAKKAQTQSARFARTLGISNDVIAQLYPLAN
jgi:hypothetical protein